jgi:hypothetical protein
VQASGNAIGKGAVMRGSQGMPALTTYRAEVAWLMNQGVPLGDIEAGIGKIADLNKHEKEALHLFASSLAGGRPAREPSWPTRRLAGRSD